MKKGAEFFLAMVCVLALAGCGMPSNAENVQAAENENSRLAVEENVVFVNIDNITTYKDKYVQYGDYLGQVAEKNIMGEEGIESADATVSYDGGTGQYSIELSIKTNGEVGNGQIEFYKSALSKIYVEVIFVVDGEVM